MSQLAVSTHYGDAVSPYFVRLRYLGVTSHLATMRVLILSGDSRYQWDFEKTISQLENALKNAGADTLTIRAPRIASTGSSRRVWGAHSGNSIFIWQSQREKRAKTKAGRREKNSRKFSNGMRQAGPPEWAYDPSSENSHKPLAYIREIRSQVAQFGNVDGVIGFADGAAVAAIIGRFLPALRFCVLYSGYRLRGRFWETFYRPPIATPTYHIIHAAKNPSIPNGHYIPRKESLDLYNACDASTRTRSRLSGYLRRSSLDDSFNSVVEFVLDYEDPSSPELLSATESSSTEGPSHVSSEDVAETRLPTPAVAEYTSTPVAGSAAHASSLQIDERASQAGVSRASGASSVASDRVAFDDDRQGGPGGAQTTTPAVSDAHSSDIPAHDTQTSGVFGGIMQSQLAPGILSPVSEGDNQQAEGSVVHSPLPTLHAFNENAGLPDGGAPAQLKDYNDIIKGAGRRDNELLSANSNADLQTQSNFWRDAFMSRQIFATKESTEDHLKRFSSHFLRSGNINIPGPTDASDCAAHAEAEQTFSSLLSSLRGRSTSFAEYHTHALAAGLLHWVLSKYDEYAMNQRKLWRAAREPASYRRREGFAFEVISRAVEDVPKLRLTHLCSQALAQDFKGHCLTAPALAAAVRTRADRDPLCKELTEDTTEFHNHMICFVAAVAVGLFIHDSERGCCLKGDRPVKWFDPSVEPSTFMLPRKIDHTKLMKHLTAYELDRAFGPLTVFDLPADKRTYHYITTYRFMLNSLGLRATLRSPMSYSGPPRRCCWSKLPMCLTTIIMAIQGWDPSVSTLKHPALAILDPFQRKSLVFIVQSALQRLGPNSTLDAAAKEVSSALETRQPPG